jgi:DNA-binding MarR family transcriptional regulator
MNDERDKSGKVGILNLSSELLEAINGRYISMRKGTRYESVRQFDGRVFVAATREGYTESEIARLFGVSRQAVHAAVERLIALKLLERQPIPGNGRDKRIALTDRGQHASQTVTRHIATVEAECEAIIGKENFQNLRLQMELISKVMTLKAQIKPPA